MLRPRSHSHCSTDGTGLCWHWLYHLPAEKRASNRYFQHVHTLAAYDEKRRAELVKTLETYLDNGSSLVDAAQALFIHRNTLLHRIDRIETLWTG